MTQESPAKYKCTGINQIGIVVNDVEQVAKNYWDILGIGPWTILDWETPLVHGRKYHGQSAWSRERLATAQVGNVQLELLQPVEGPSVYRDWLLEHGEGLHHMMFLVDDADETFGVLAGEGFPCMASGKFVAQGGAETRYGYFDIQPLRAIFEPVQFGGYPDVEARLIPPTTTESPAKYKCTGINQIGIVVNDVEQVAKNYWDILGIGPWTILDWETPLVHGRKYHGQSAWSRERLATAQVGNVQLELLQPVEGPSVYRDWLLEHGEGLHHMMFLVDDADETFGVLAGEGFPCMASGKFVAQGGAETRYGYFDIQPLRAIFEPVQFGGYPDVEARLIPS